jgi:hypothetical protein
MPPLLLIVKVTGTETDVAPAVMVIEPW